jgi:hypothetical protein
MKMRMSMVILYYLSADMFLAIVREDSSARQALFRKTPIMSEGCDGCKPGSSVERKYDGKLGIRTEAEYALF